MSITSTMLRAAMPMLGFMALLTLPFIANAAETAGDSAAPVINTVCPMDGKTINMANCKMVMMTVGEGTEAKRCRMACCSDACCSEFMKDPGAAMKSQFIGPKGGDTRKGH